MTKFKLKILIGIVCIAMAIHGFSLICGNGAGTAYTNDGSEADSKNSGNTINLLIEDAAAHFMLSKSDILYFSNLYEMADSGIDFNQWRESIDNAIYNLEKSQKFYSNIIQTAEATPYNMPVLEKLANFNYLAFVSSNNLNTSIMQQVESFLSRGDITGMFKEISDKLKAVDAVLRAIDNEVTIDTIPGVESVWRLNNEVSEFMLFGEYVAMVFYEINQ